MVGVMTLKTSAQGRFFPQPRSADLSSLAAYERGEKFAAMALVGAMVNEHASLVPVTALNAGLDVGAPRKRTGRRKVGIGIGIVASVAVAHGFTVGQRTPIERVVEVATPSAPPPAPTSEPTRASGPRRSPERRVERRRRRARHRPAAKRSTRPAVSPARVTTAPARPAPTAIVPPAQTPDGFTEEFF